MTPFDEMNRTFREMDRAFDHMRATWLREFAAPGFGAELESGPASLESGRPALGEGWPALEEEWAVGSSMGGTAATLEDEGDAYVFVMDLPGFEKADIDLTYDEGTLTIDAQTDVEEGADAARSVRSRRVGRHVPIPKAIVTDEISATYHNGVLEVRLPIIEDDREDTGHRIDID